MNPGQVADEVAAIVEARASNNHTLLVDRLDDLIFTGPLVNALNVTLMLAGILAEDVGRDPAGDSPWDGTGDLDEDGRVRAGSTVNLPGHVATFVQMVVAVAGQDRDTARGLFVDYVGRDGKRALALLVLALNEAMYQGGHNSPAAPESEVWAWTV